MAYKTKLIIACFIFFMLGMFAAFGMVPFAEFMAEQLQQAQYRSIDMAGLV